MIILYKIPKKSVVCIIKKVRYKRSQSRCQIRLRKKHCITIVFARCHTYNSMHTTTLSQTQGSYINPSGRLKQRICFFRLSFTGFYLKQPACCPCAILCAPRSTNSLRTGTDRAKNTYTPCTHVVFMGVYFCFCFLKERVF